MLKMEKEIVMNSIYDDDIKQTEIEIAEIKSMQSELQVALAEKNGILKFLKSKRDSFIAAPSEALVSEAVDAVTNDIIDLSKLDVPNQYRKTLMDDISSVVSKLGEQEFMVTSVEAVLKAQGVVIEGKSPRARIASTLGKLLEQGKLVQTFKGSGNVPHRYRLAQNSETVVTIQSNNGLDL